MTSVTVVVSLRACVQLRDWHNERDTLLGEIGSVQAVNQIHRDRAAIEQKVQAQVARWRELVASAEVGDGRQLLNEMLEAPLRFTPLPERGKVYEFAAPVATGKVIAGLIGYPPEDTSPTGPGLSYQPVFHTIWRSDRRAA